MVWFSYNLLKFDIVYADVPFCKRGHDLEMEVKLNKAWHHFLPKLSFNMAADFQLIPSEDTRKWTKNVHPYIQFCFIEKKTDLTLSQMLARVSLQQQWLIATWNIQMSTILAQKPVVVLSFERQNTRALKGFVCKLRWIFTQKISSAELVFPHSTKTSSSSYVF